MNLVDGLPPPTATLVHWVVQSIQSLQKEILEQRQAPEIRVADYGTGTGMLTYELIKTLDETGMLATMRQQGIRFEMNLLDLPSHWFDFSKKLLGHLEFVKFHDIFKNYRKCLYFYKNHAFSKIKS